MTSFGSTKPGLKQFAASTLHHSGLIKELQKRAVPSWRILLYHRVIEESEVPYPVQPNMFVRPDTFRTQMEYLAKNCSVIPLERLTEMIASDTPVPPKTMVLTFDDGWADTYTHAFPLLREFELPATVFLVTSFINTNQIFWWDKLALSATALWKQRDSHNKFRKRLEDNKELSDKEISLLERLLVPEDFETFLSVLSQAIEELEKLPQTDRFGPIQELFTLAQEFAGASAPREFLTWKEIREMAESGISFGNHTHLHQDMTQLSETQINDEIENSTVTLRTNSIEPSSVFGYPMGLHTSRTQQALSKKNYQFAVSGNRCDNLKDSPALLGRVNMYEEISNTIPLFSYSVWGR